ncbi:glycosyltransferase [Lutibacter sp. B1]|uniref:glycosyltransferase n=1 Tax=Lutibacter sp. B1 TaxID=2725996 RepID=UPI001B3A0BFC
MLKAGFEPILASDGNALLLLQKEFPSLKFYTLPSYNIKYTKSGKNLKFKLFLHFPSIISAVKKEKKIVHKIILNENVAGIISDNRFGVFSKKVPSVYITHQLNVLSGKSTYLTSKIHQKIIKKYNQCWVPDMEGKESLSGELGHLLKRNLMPEYIGVLSRFKRRKTVKKYNLMVFLSGPEPQRTLLENILLNKLKDVKEPVLFVRGILSDETEISAPENFNVVNYLNGNDLEMALNESKLIIARSGYSTIMDLAVLGKKAFFIPTPGQYEQEYLAEILNDKRIAPYAKQHKFTLENLKKVENFNGFKSHQMKLDLDLFNLFKSK